jgi:Flp pilus assembly protein TadG
MDARGRERGAVSIEFAFGIPVLLFAVLSGITLGRALLTRHRLADATAFGARAAAVAGETNGDTVHDLVAQQFSDEANRCASLNVVTQVIPGAAPDTQALQVTSTCALVPMFNSEWLSVFTPSEITVVAAMPL